MVYEAPSAVSILGDPVVIHLQKKCLFSETKELEIATKARLTMIAVSWLGIFPTFESKVKQPCPNLGGLLDTR
jgi:hypothetical protein